jgi:uncharacterized membrane protein
MQRKCDELQSDNERLDSDIAQALTKIDQLEERAKNQEEEGQHREDAFASELSETKELLQEMKQSVKVKRMLFKNTVENAPKAIISELQYNEV